MAAVRVSVGLRAGHELVSCSGLAGSASVSCQRASHAWRNKKARQKGGTSKKKKQETGAEFKAGTYRQNQKLRFTPEEPINVHLSCDLGKLMDYTETIFRPGLSYLEENLRLLFLARA